MSLLSNSGSCNLLCVSTHSSGVCGSTLYKNTCLILLFWVKPLSCLHLGYSCTVLSLGPEGNSTQMLVLVSTTISQVCDSLVVHVRISADSHLMLHDSLLRMSLQCAITKYQSVAPLWFRALKHYQASLGLCLSHQTASKPLVRRYQYVASHIFRGGKCLSSMVCCDQTLDKYNRNSA